MPETIRDLLIERGTNAETADRVFLRYEDQQLTYAEFLGECSRYAHLFLAEKRKGPFHVGVMMWNYPEFLFAWGGAALCGATIVGINYTFAGEPLRRDIDYTDCQMIVTEPQFVEPLAEVADGCAKLQPEKIFVTSRAGDASEDEPHPGWRWLDDALDDASEVAKPGPTEPPAATVKPKDTLMIVFTSGTTGAPKGILTSQQKFVFVGTIDARLELTPDDVVYFSQPLFHSNSFYLGVTPAITAGCGLAFRPKFSSSNWLKDIKRYGATAGPYVGKTLSYLLETEPGPADADQPLRVMVGNGASTATRHQFLERYGLQEIIELYGSTEGAISTFRRPDDPADSVGWVRDDVKILDDEGNECPNGVLDADGHLTNAQECVGQIVRVGSTGTFEGYYKNDDATSDKTRDGNFWSGDLGHVEVHEKKGTPMRFLFFDGRLSDWIRYNGENFPTEPIEWLIEGNDAVSSCAVYGVPNAHGDEDVMAALVLQPDAAFDPAAFREYLESHPDYLDLWIPEYIRVLDDPPWTLTHKLQKHKLQRQQFNIVEISDDMWMREGQEYIVFDQARFTAVQELFEQKGRTKSLV